MSVARISVSVDGQVWGAGSWGNQPPRLPAEYVAYHAPGSVFTACGGTALDDHGVSAGAHVGEMTVWLPGMQAALPPLRSASTSPPRVD